MTSEQLTPFLDGFLELLVERGEITCGQLAVGMDLRESSPSIARIVEQWALSRGITIDLLGPVPTPALAYYCLKARQPGIMITGSHIPSDRNGLKFYFSSSEIFKEDEARILELRNAVLKGDWNPRQVAQGGKVPKESALPKAPNLHGASSAVSLFMDRYLGSFPKGFLSGKRVLVYQHSSAARDVLTSLIQAFGGEAIPTERSDVFVAVDTENLHRLDELGHLVKMHHADALVSTDGDGDRPLVLDEQGRLIRGDLLGCISAGVLKASRVATPVTSSSIVELCQHFQVVERTKVGSPYVIAALSGHGSDVRRQSGEIAIGFEANGGVIVGSDVVVEPGLRALEALLTRDSVLPILLTLLASVRKGCTLSQLRADWPARANESGLISPVLPEASAAVLRILGNEVVQSSSHRQSFAHLHEVSFVPLKADSVDGLRCISADHEVVHFRPSGNAPEFRVYTESTDPERARVLLRHALDVVRSMHV